MHIINDTLIKMYEILDEYSYLVEDEFSDYKLIKYALKKDIVNIAISIFKVFCPNYKEILEKEFASALNINISKDELNYLIEETENISCNKNVPRFLDMAVDVENNIYYMNNYKCNICLPLVMSILDMAKRIIIEYYYDGIDIVFFIEDEEGILESVEDYIQNLLDYLDKNLDTMENTVRFFLQEEEIAAPKKRE